MLNLGEAIPLLFTIWIFAYTILRPIVVGFLGYWSAGWASSKGKIITATVKKKRLYRGQSGFAPYLKYSYEVHGKEYTSTRINFEMTFTALEKEDAREYIGEYEIGQDVEIYYLSIFPRFSVLECGFYISNASMFVFVVGILLTYLLWANFL